MDNKGKLLVMVFAPAEAGFTFGELPSVGAGSGNTPALQAGPVKYC